MALAPLGQWHSHHRAQLKIAREQAGSSSRMGQRMGSAEQVPREWDNSMGNGIWEDQTLASSKLRKMNRGMEASSCAHPRWRGCRQGEQVCQGSLLQQVLLPLTNARVERLHATAHFLQVPPPPPANTNTEL